MVWAAIIVFVFLCIVVLLWKASKGPPHSLASIKTPISDLLKRGYDGGFLIIDLHRSKYFVQLRKYIKAPGVYGIELWFPKAKWSSGFFDRLRKFCNENNLSASNVTDNSDNQIEFLRIDFADDQNKALSTVQFIILKIFGADEQVRLYVKLENASIKDELIDR